MRAYVPLNTKGKHMRTAYIAMDGPDILIDDVTPHASCTELEAFLNGHREFIDTHNFRVDNNPDYIGRRKMEKLGKLQYFQIDFDGEGKVERFSEMTEQDFERQLRAEEDEVRERERNQRAWEQSMWAAWR